MSQPSGGSGSARDLWVFMQFSAKNCQIIIGYPLPRENLDPPLQPSGPLLIVNEDFFPNE